LKFHFYSGVSSLGQDVRIGGPNGELSEHTLSLPYAFYNEIFDFAVGYVCGMTSCHQKPVTR
jgi:hypothetical protein